MTERIVVVGGDAGGMAAISQIRKGKPDAHVVALERGNWTSYSACGIPFLVGGTVTGGLERLIARTPEQHRRNGIDLRMRHEAMAIDVASREVEVRDHDGATTYRLGFDHLLIGTGGRPIRPPLPGIDLPFVHGVQTLDDAAHLLEHASAGCQKVVIVGSGYIGLEMAEAFVDRGCRSTVIDRSSHPLALLDPELGDMVAAQMRSRGIELQLSTDVLGFEPGRVLTSAGSVDADLVLLGIGVAPNSGLAAEAGITLGVNRAIRVDERQETSVEGIWAAGDCAESTHLVTGEPVHIALGTYANRQARVAGVNIGGGRAIAPKVLGTAITKLCDMEIALTGLNSAHAARAGFDAVTETIESSTKAGYFPGSSKITVRLVIGATDGRLLGAQIVGGDDSAKRIDTCVAAVTAGMDVQQIVDLDLAYAPPFSPVWDPIAVAAREALKLL